MPSNPMQAVHFVAGQLERAAANAIFNADEGDRQSVVDCIMAAFQEAQTKIVKCGTKPGQGPRCPPGSHSEFNVCVPDG
jgi:hypothetical protein